MGDWPLISGSTRFQNYGSNAGNSTLTTVTANASADTKGSFTQITASTDFDADMIYITVIKATGDNLIDIAVGAAASEQVVAENLLLSVGDINSGGIMFPLPFLIPSGTRISARVQSSTGSNTVSVGVMISKKGFLLEPSFGRVTNYGANTSDSGATQIDPGSTINTKGSYSQIVASTTNPCKSILLNFGQRADTGLGTIQWFVDIAIGAASSEQIIIPDFIINSNANGDDIYPKCSRMMFVDIPEGSRISARSQCSGNDAIDRLFDINLIALD